MDRTQERILLSTASFPPVGYIVRIVTADEVWMECHENYAKQTYRNRYCLYGPGGAVSLVIPVHRPAGHHTLITEVLTGRDSPWRRIHWRALESWYNRSPFFSFYAGELFPVIMEGPGNLFGFNQAALQLVLGWLGVEKPILLTSSYDRTPEKVTDLRYRIHPKRSGGSIGLALFPRYIQVFEHMAGFIPNLSILDLLFNEGPSGAEYILRLADQLKGSG
ncbi:MAG: WbqC family protein [Bacteroidales bacterium]|nr:WbqC family protein [Bacteroidales bacterium]